MKKIYFIFIISMLSINLVSCARTPAKSETPSVAQGKSLEEIMTMIMEDVPDLPAQYTTEVTADNFSYYFFIDPVEGAEGLSSDSMIGSIAHSVCLLRVPEGIDAAEIAKNIERNVDPRKWICTEAEKVIIRNEGDLILLIMSFEDTTDAINANFDERIL